MTHIFRSAFDDMIGIALEPLCLIRECEFYDVRRGNKYARDKLFFFRLADGRAVQEGYILLFGSRRSDNQFSSLKVYSKKNAAHPDHERICYSVLAFITYLRDEKGFEISGSAFNLVKQYVK